MKNFSVVITGGAGFLGRAIVRALLDRGVRRIIVPRRSNYDLTSLEAAVRLYEDAKPDIVIHAAAEVGGIGANMKAPGRFFYANAAMGMNLVEGARLFGGLKKFVHIGTVCAYPKHCPVPFSEADLWSGYPEETNAPYGIAKKAIFVMLEAYREQYGMASSVIVPTNLYGPHDNFDRESSHVIPAMIREFDEARMTRQKVVTLWGTGAATREFLHVDDAAEGIIRAAERIEEPLPINLGGGREIAIRDLANMIADLTNYTGEIAWDSSKPDGQPRRCVDTSRARDLLEWSPKVEFVKGLSDTINWWRANA